MIYLVSNQKRLFNSIEFAELSVEEAIEKISKWDIVQYDSETTGRNPHINDLLCCQFGNRQADTQIVVDTTTVPILKFKQILETKLLIGHNLKFDIQFLYKHKIIPTKCWDTMIIEQLLHLGYDIKHFKYNLHDVAMRYLGINIDKTVRGEIIWRGLDTQVILYAAGDVMYLEDIRDKQLEKCKTQKCLVGADLENNFVPVISYLEWCGIKLDVNIWKKKIADNDRLIEEFKNKLDTYLINWCKSNPDKSSVKNYDIVDVQFWPDNKIDDLVNKYRKQGKVLDKYENDSLYFINSISCPYYKIERQGDLFSGFNTDPICTVNWDSSKQLIPIFQMLGFDTKVKDKKTGKTKDSVSEKVISKQKGINDEFLEIYLEYTKIVKDASTYGQNYIDAINPITGRIHTKFKQLGAVSGRMSCGGGNKDFDSELAVYKKLPANRCKFVLIGPL